MRFLVTHPYSNTSAVYVGNWLCGICVLLLLATLLAPVPAQAQHPEGSRPRVLELTPPQDVTVQLLDDGHIRIAWTPGPPDVMAVVEYFRVQLNDFVFLTRTDATDGAITYLPGEDDGYQYRVKYVWGNDESVGVEAIPIAEGQPIEFESFLFLPIMQGRAD